MQKITVRATPRSITVAPTRLGLPQNSGNQVVEWHPQGTEVVILGIEFEGNAPISDLEPSGVIWTGVWSTLNQGTWKYTVKYSVKGIEKTPLDPEIENGPPGGGMDEEDEDDDEDDGEDDDEDEVEEDGERW